MAIEVKLDGDAEQQIPQQPTEQSSQKPEEKSNYFVKGKIRRTLDNNIIVSDHPDVDIVIMPQKMKIVTFVKDSMDDSIYQTQDRFFKYMQRKGAILPESIRGGNVFGSVEGKIAPPEKKMPVDEICLLLVSKFIEEEKPAFTYEQEIEDMTIDNMTNPDSNQTTELGKVPHAAEKGSIPIHQVRRYAYGL